MLIFAACKFNLKCIVMAKKEEYVEITGGDIFVSLDSGSEKDESTKED